MSWEHRLPEGVSGFRKTSSGFEGAVSILLDEDGFFGRECPSCARLFKLREDEWLALPDDPLITCPYCGHHSTDASDFTTTQQQERALSAGQALAEQYAHDAIRDAFSGFGTRGSRSSRSRGFGIEVSVSHSPQPPVRSLVSYVEKEVRRTIACDNCETHYAVYGATAFCPVCGPRAAAETVLEAIERGRRALALEHARSPRRRRVQVSLSAFELAQVPKLVAAEPRPSRPSC